MYSVNLSAEHMNNYADITFSTYWESINQVESRIIENHDKWFPMDLLSC